MCSLDLKEGCLEERIHRIYWNDGSLDLTVGLAVLAIGVAWLMGQIALSPVSLAVAVPIWMTLRKALVEPRLGQVVFSESRRKRERRGMNTVLGSGIGILALVLLATVVMRRTGPAGETLQGLVPGLPAVLLGGLGIACGLLFRLPRLTLYGGVAIVMAGLGILLGWEPHVQILLSGAAPALTGMTMLSYFLWEYPRTGNEEDADEAAEH